MPRHVPSPGRATVTRPAGDTFHAAVSFVSLPVHRVFSTKNRESLIRDEIQTRLYEYMGGIFRTQKSKLIAAGGMPDHVHLLVWLDKH
ncbi:MAG: IS200/IS605 family transposase [Pirellulaceae bacterium]